MGFTWRAASQRFSRSPSHLKSRDSRDVRLILDTEGEKGSPNKNTQRKALHTAALGDRSVNSRIKVLETPGGQELW